MQKKQLRSHIARDQRLAGGFKYYAVFYTLFITAAAVVGYHVLRLFQQRGQFTGFGFSFDDSATAFAVYVYLFLIVTVGRLLVRPAFLSYPDLFENRWYLYSKFGISPGELTTKKILITSLFMLGSYTVGAGIFLGVLFLIKTQVIIASCLTVFLYGLIALSVIIFVPLFLSSFFDSYGWYVFTLALAAVIAAAILFLGGVFGISDAESFAAAADRVFSLGGATPLLIWLGTMAVSVFGATVVPSKKALRYRDMIVYPDKVATREASRITGKAVYRDVKTVAASIPASKPKRLAGSEESSALPDMSETPDESATVSAPVVTDNAGDMQPEDHAEAAPDETIEFSPDEVVVEDEVVRDILSDDLSDEDIVSRLSEAAAEISGVREDEEELPPEDITDAQPADTYPAVVLPPEDHSENTDQTAQSSDDSVDEFIEKILSGEADDIASSSEDADAGAVPEGISDIGEQAADDQSAYRTVDAAVVSEQPVPAEWADESRGESGIPDSAETNTSGEFDLTGLDFAEPDMQTSLYSKDEMGDDWLDPAEASLLFDGDADNSRNEPEVTEPLEGQLTFDEVGPVSGAEESDELSEPDMADLPKHPVLKGLSIISLVLAVLGLIPSAISLINRPAVYGGILSILTAISGSDNAQLIVDTLQSSVGRFLFIGSTAILFAVYLGFKFLLADIRRKDMEELEDEDEDE
ncbi:MAG: hypothetical protein IKE18_10925 [Oscillospiraceae bacterium]|nr:hypothetical protein [Oscillospiraceae bacterium]